MAALFLKFREFKHMSLKQMIEFNAWNFFRFLGSEKHGVTRTALLTHEESRLYLQQRAEHITLVETYALELGLSLYICGIRSV